MRPDATQLESVLDSILNALREANHRAGRAAPQASAEQEAESRALMAVIDAVRGAGPCAETTVETRTDSHRSLEDSLSTVLYGLNEHLALHYKELLGGEVGLATLAAVRGDEGVPDFLRLAGIPFYEGAHSGVIRSLLDPRSSPAVAPLLLAEIVEAVLESEKEADRSAWRRCLERAFQGQARQAPSVAVRTEIPIGQHEDVEGRIDVLVSGPDFVLAIESKTQSLEHDNQTRTYERWLNSRHPSFQRAGVFLTPEGAHASSGMFRPLSFLRLLGLLLKVHRVCSGASRQEVVVLGSYIKTLANSILVQQLAVLGR